MKTVLITGAFGAGKSSTLSLLSKKSHPIFKADDKAKELLLKKSPCYAQLRDIFPSVLKHDGEIDQQKLAEEIFSQPERRKTLQNIIHPLVRKSFSRFVADCKKRDKRLVFCEASLISKNIFNWCECQILVSCPKAEREKRLLKKGWIKTDIERRMRAQISEDEIIHRVDYIIDNSHSIENLKTEVKKCLDFIL